MILSPRLCAHEHCDCIYIFPQGISPGEDNISIIGIYIYLSSTASLHVLSFLFVYMCLSVWLLQIYPFAIFFYLSGSSRFGYLSVDLSIDLLIYLLFYLSVYWPIWEHDSLICTYINTVYIFLSLSSSYHQSVFLLSNYLQVTYFCIQHLYTSISTCLYILLPCFFCLCVWVCLVLVCLLLFPRT